MPASPKYLKLTLDRLKPGMVICRLDKDTQTTPFATRHWLFSNHEDFKREFPDSRYVYVDLSYSQDLDPQEKRRKLYLNLHQQLDPIMNAARLGNALQQKRLRKLLKELMEAVLHDPKSMTYLALLREHQDALVSKSINVALLSLVFAKHIGLRQDQLIPLGQGALLHGLGLVHIPASILTKSEPLNEQERQLIRSYPRRGYEYLAAQGDFDDLTLDIVLHHQERANGQGYPDQLQGREISFLARLVAITSVYEALTRQRSYSQASSPSKALGQLYRWRFKDFDSRLVEKFIHSLGVYPPGCLVQLNDGCLAVVQSTQAKQRLKPEVRLLTNAQLEPLSSYTLCSLAEQKKLSIRQALDPKDPRVESLLQRLAQENQDLLI